MERKSAEEGTWLDRNVSSSFLLLAGLLFSLMIVIERSLCLKCLQLLFLFLVNVLLRKQLRVVNKLILALFIVFFNLLSPAGEVILKIFSFPVTRDALRVGMGKALNIVCLIYLSKIVVRDDIMFPGEIGRLIGRTFGFFSRLSSYRGRISVKRLFQDLDEVFLTVYEERADGNTYVRRENSFLGIFVIGVIFLLNLVFLYFLN